MHVAAADRTTAEQIVAVAAHETQRIEAKYSRYRPGNIVHAINNAAGRTIVVDEETARLLDYAQQLFELSDGKFDVTSGVLRRAWRFDGSDRVPSRKAVAALLAIVGWQKARWQAPELTLLPGMEIDFGGIGKEYAVDRAAALVRPLSSRCLLNFGGDLFALGPQEAGASVARRHRVADRWRYAGQAHRPRARSARDERRRAAFFGQGRQALQPHSRSHDRLARRRCAALGDRGRAFVHARRHGRDVRVAARL